MESKEIMTMITKAGLNMVPMVGGAIGSIIGDLQAQRKEERMNEFLVSFTSEMQERIEKIESSYIMQDDFLDIFENILRDIMNQRAKIKRECFRHLLVNSITTPNTTYNMTEEYQFILLRMSEIHILILEGFYEKRHINKNSEREDLEEIFDSVKEKVKGFNITHNKIIEMIVDLENLNLVNHYTHNLMNIESGVPVYDNEPYISEKGILFIDYVSFA